MKLRTQYKVDLCNFSLNLCCYKYGGPCIVPNTQVKENLPKLENFLSYNPTNQTLHMYHTTTPCCFSTSNFKGGSTLKSILLIIIIIIALNISIRGPLKVSGKCLGDIAKFGDNPKWPVLLI